MATKSIWADIQAANSKLAQFLRRQEDEEMILQIGKRKPKQAREERLPGGSGRWALDPDWKAPTPMVDRPRTVAGSTSFHFSYTTISKSGVPTVNGAPVEGTFGKSRTPALDHSKYIERDGAAEISQGAEHAGYIERLEAVENIDPSGVIAEQHARSIAHIVNENPTDEEASLLGIEAVAPEGIPSVFSNISDDPFERQEFWRAVERIERAPRSHSIILEPDVGSDWWASLEADTLLPADFRAHALNVAEAYRQHLAALSPEGSRKPFEAQPFSASAEKAGKIIAAAQRMPAYCDWAPPFEFKSGRGGRVQFRMVAELPHELTAEDRALIVQNFCDHLGSLQERRHIDGTPYRTGMMYTAVIHAPDAHNDSRNYHLHVVAYDRPAKFFSEQSQWDFEIAETYRDPGSGKDRVRWPYRQAKLEDLARTEAGRNPETTGKNFIPTLRAKFAEINNAVLKARGLRRRLDPRKYSEMGIHRTPTEHLGSKAAALEAIGVVTTIGQLNALLIWSDAERAIERQAVEAAKVNGDAQADLESLLRTARLRAAMHRDLPDFSALVAERGRLISNVVDDRTAIMKLDHSEAKAKSRATRALLTCRQFLADIEHGRAAASIKRGQLPIEDRSRAAQHHIDAIDGALAPHREALRNAALSVERREARVAEIDCMLSSMVDQLRLLVAMPQSRRQEAAPLNATAATKPAVLTERESAPRIAAEVGQAPKAREPILPAELAPVSMEGQPIVEPTLMPRGGKPAVENIRELSTPEGLNPLRPVASTQPTAGADFLISDDLSQPVDRAGDTPPLDAEPRIQAGGAGLQTVGPNGKNNKLSARTEKASSAQPTLRPGVPPRSGQSPYDEFDALVRRIMSNRIPIHTEKTESTGFRFTVPSLTPTEQDILIDPRFAHRAKKRLGAIFGKQVLEVQRAVRWIESAGQDPRQLKLKSRSAALAPNVKQGIKTLFKHWGRHANVIAALNAEHNRRIELARVRPAEAAIQRNAQVHDDAERNARRMEAADLYPEAKHAFTEEVEAFITLLRDAAPEEDLKAACDKIEASSRAREDISRHNVELEKAYERFLPPRNLPGITAGQGYGY